MTNPPPQPEDRVEEVGMEKQEHTDGAMSQHPNNPRTYQTLRRTSWCVSANRLEADSHRSNQIQTRRALREVLIAFLNRYPSTRS